MFENRSLAEEKEEEEEASRTNQAGCCEGMGCGEGEKSAVSV